MPDLLILIASILALGTDNLRQSYLIYYCIELKILLFLKQTYILVIMLMIVDSLLKPIATSLRKIMVLENLPPTFILVKRICLTLHHVYGT